MAEIVLCLTSILLNDGYPSGHEMIALMATVLVCLIQPYLGHDIYVIYKYRDYANLIK